MGDKIAQLNSLLNSGSVENALKVAISNPPYDADQATKDRDVDAVVQALSAFKDAQIDKALDQLTIDELDVLTKYILKGLEKGNASNQLFKWFEKTKNKVGGLGSIVRAMSDKNRL